MSASITIKMRECLAERLAKAADTVGLCPDELVRCATAHLVAAIEENGRLVFPLAVASTAHPATMRPAYDARTTGSLQCPCFIAAAEKEVEP